MPAWLCGADPSTKCLHSYRKHTGALEVLGFPNCSLEEPCSLFHHAVKVKENISIPPFRLVRGHWAGKLQQSLEGSLVASSVEVGVPELSQHLPCSSGLSLPSENMLGSMVKWDFPQIYKEQWYGDDRNEDPTLWRPLWLTALGTG